MPPLPSFLFSIWIVGVFPFNFIISSYLGLNSGLKNLSTKVLNNLFILSPLLAETNWKVDSISFANSFAKFSSAKLSFHINHFCFQQQLYISFNPKQSPIVIGRNPDCDVIIINS